MPNLSWNEIQDRAAEFASKWKGETYEKGESQSFWGDFLDVYGIDRRRHGAFFEYAIKKGSGKQGFIDMFWPGKLLAEQKSGGKDLSKANIQAYEYLETMPDHDLPHAVVMSDFANFVLIEQDGKNEKIEFTLEDFPKQVKLFAFLIEQKSKHLAEEDPVNIKAAEAMAKLHNKLKENNYNGHDLEVLLVRLVFCMFADDSGIFDNQSLSDYLRTRTSEDGSDLGPRLLQIFEMLNTTIENRQSSLDEAIASLPYVNGGLFEETIRTPSFDSKMRAELLKAMELDWSKVSPAIFGSMFQGVMDEKERRNLGAHYTSEKNILRVIKPLFLDDLYKEFAECSVAGPRKKYDELRKFQNKLAGLKFLDPACGCGNFLVITYRELRRLEHKVVTVLANNKDQQDMLASAGEGVGTLRVDVDQMYGIEIEEFPSLIAQTALWLTDHQMNLEFSRESGRTFKRIPLTHSATIRNANALTTDWADIIDPNELNYILGNPPFIGAAFKTKTQSNELRSVLGGKNLLKLDYVAGWYFKATYMMQQNHKIQTALVSTNSIIQGEQVPLLWSSLFRHGVKINFAHQTFRWINDAKGKAAVYCTIVGFALFDKLEKYIFEYVDIKGDPNEIIAKNINGYALDAANIFITKLRKPLCDVPHMIRGSIPYDGGNLLLTEDEYSETITKYPEIKNFIRRYGGAYEMLNNKWRYCLWLVEVSPSEIKSSPFILDRVHETKKFREDSETNSVNSKKDTPTLFGDIRQPENDYLLLPRVSSERRDYLPIGYFGNETIVGDSAYAIPDATLYHFGILTSQMHMSWMRFASGRLKSDYRYSKDIVYNNFIWPETTATQRNEIEKLAQAVLDARVESLNSTLADLYDPLTMPPHLVKSHKSLDDFVDRLYQKEPFTSDTERVSELLKLYQKKADFF
jgi:type I restriction-modification system DNA methylase subunit